MSVKKWQMLTRLEVEGKSLYGFRGWLVFVYVLAALLLLWQISGGLMNGEGQAKMYGGKEAANIMSYVLILKGLSWLPFLVMAPVKHPKTVQVVLVCIVVVTIIDFIAINFVIDLPLQRAMGVNVFNLLVAGSFAIYFLRSKRVNLTYRWRELAA